MNDEQAAAPRVGPDHRDLYLIIAGIVLGVLLSPAVLGRINPSAYASMFRGGTEIEAQLVAEREQWQITRDNLVGSSPTGVAIEEFDARPRDNEILLEARLREARIQHRQAMVGRNTAIILAVLALMLVETLIDPTQLSLRSRLASARYALLAVWLAMMLASPTLFAAVPTLFLAALVIVALAAALVPMGRRGQA